MLLYSFRPISGKLSVKEPKTSRHTQTIEGLFYRKIQPFNKGRVGLPERIMGTGGQYSRFTFVGKARLIQ
jgi:hypothetical protein